jgi:hypothetical protein
MNSDTPKYYRPYDSDDDTVATDDELSDSGSEDYDSDELPKSEDIRIRREEDPRYAIIRAAGPNFNTSAEQLKYMEHAPGSIYDNNTNISSLHNLTYLNPPKTTQTSLFTVKSINRDTQVYTSPFNFQLKTPRVYKNVTKLQLVQISFPNNTTEFIDSPLFALEFAEELLKRGLNPECLSTCVSISGCTPVTNSFGVIEKGRISDGYPKMYKFSIPSGQYSNEQIANSLNTTCNNTPPLNIISYDEFKTEFQTHRDIYILFNEPGDCFYSNITKTSYRTHSKQDIMNTYYPELHLDSFPVITDKIAFNAYYYPILKELIVMNVSRPFINTSPYTFEQVYDFVLGKFLGLDSDIYYNMCLNNQGVLDNFRKQLTFEHNPINKYIWSYNNTTRQFSVLHNSLHTSIKNDINNKYNSYFNHQLSVSNLTSRTFQSLKKDYATYNTVLKDLESYLSTQLANYFLTTNNYNYSGGLLHAGYNVTDLHSDAGFTSLFNFSKTFGKQFHSNFHGQNLSFTNFLDYHSTISSYHNLVQTNNSIISTLQGLVNENHHNYVSTKYSNIFPNHLITTKSYNYSQGVPVSFVGNLFSYSNGQSVTHPLVVAQSFSEAPPGFTLSEPSPCEIECCTIIENIVRTYYGCLEVGSIVSSLPYRLGLTNFDFTNFNAISTIFNITSTSIFDIFLQLNNEQSLNNMDISGPENYNIVNETTGQVKLMAAKILLQGVGAGEASETAIQNPIIFETPLGKLDKLSFKFYLDDKALSPLWLAYPFAPGFNEWNATFQIDEEIAFADRNAGFGTNPTIPIPNNPNALQYFALTSMNNPLNK